MIVFRIILMVITFLIIVGNLFLDEEQPKEKLYISVLFITYFIYYLVRTEYYRNKNDEISQE